VDVLLGIIKPDSGTATISGAEAQESINLWPGALAYVPQNVVMLNGSIRENVCMGFEPNLNQDAKIDWALEIADLTNFVESLPNGLDSNIGDRGSSISGGQRQRLGIARALFTAPKLLVLDEATSALDGETELNISNAIQALKGEVTVVLIAHRLSTVREADIVLYLECGQVRGAGSFEQVREQVPDFDRQAQLMGL
jgi:ABC-type bacteriocin/lantibiotic exporter with double-glycine peptidase domain